LITVPTRFFMKEFSPAEEGAFSATASRLDR